MSKQKKEQFKTPVGRAIWPHVHAPDKKFKPEYGEYRTKLALSEEAAQPIIDQIDAAIKAQLVKAQEEFAKDEKNKGKSFKNSKLAKLADKPYQIGEGEEAGTVTFNFKSPAGGKRKDGTDWFRQIPVFDASGAPVKAGTRVGQGSDIKVAYTLNPFSTPIGTGMSLRLEAVQVITMRQFERDAKSFGFEAEEGFSVNETEESTERTADETTESDTPAAGSDF